MARDGASGDKVRLPRYLAMAGVASRRKSEDLIAAGVVAVNGRTVTLPGTSVDPAADRVTVRGRPVRPREEGGRAGAAIVALHKPRGVLTTRPSGARGGRTVYDLVAEPAGTRLHYVGRLDRESEGLLLMTADGTLAHRLTHPRWEVERAYEAWVSGPLDERALQRAAQRGLEVGDGERAAPFRVRVLGVARGARRLELVLREGKKREVRRIVTALGGKVERLVRTRYGTVELGSLAPGKWRRLGAREAARLRSLVDLEGEAE